MERSGHYCRVCGCCKPNENFSGKGHRDHICKSCQKMPMAKRQEIHDRDFVWTVMHQKNISKGNIEALERIAATYAGELGKRGAALAEMAIAKPHRRKRIEWLHYHRRPLFLELVRLGLIPDWGESSEEDSVFVDDACMELRCLEIDTELRFHADLLDAYEAEVLGGISA